MDRACLTVIFGRTADWLAQEAHVRHGGLFVPLPTPPPEPLAAVGVRLVGPAGDAVDLEARVVQVAPGAGLALAFVDAAAARTALTPILAAARRAGADAGRDAPPRTEWGRVDPPAPTAPTDAETHPAQRPGAPGKDEDSEEGRTLWERVRTMPKAERRQLALHGDRSSRLTLMKMADKDLHRFVIQNPGLTIDEVQYIAAYRQTHPEVLRRIAESREWLQNPRVVSNLVCNPKTPSSLAVRLLDRLPQGEVSRIARSNATPPAVQAAARRKVIGG